MFASDQDDQPISLFGTCFYRSAVQLFLITADWSELYNSLNKY